MAINYRNIIVLEVLSQGSKVEGTEVLESATIGEDDDCSAIVVAEDHIIVDDDIMAQLARAQGTDPGFFGLGDAE